MKWQANTLLKPRKTKQYRLCHRQIQIYKAVNPESNPQASSVIFHSQLYACPEEMEPFEDYLRTQGCLTSLGDKHQQVQPGRLLALILA